MHVNSTNILVNKKLVFNIRIKTFIFIMFIAFTSGCSFFHRGKNFSNELNNKFNREIISNYSKAISRNPQNFLYYIERGRAKHAYGDYVEAIQDYKNSFSLNPDLKVIFYMANSKYAYGDHNGAIKEYEKLLSKNLFQDQVFYYIANSHLILLDYDDAIKNYTKSINYDQDDANAYLNRGNVKFNIRDYKGSLKDYEKSININKKCVFRFRTSKKTLSSS